MIKKENRIFYSILAIFFGILLNLFFSYLNILLSLPIFLDTIFTILTAALFGLWPALLVGLFTNIIMEVISGFSGLYYPFFILNMLTGVIAYLFIKNNKFESTSHAFWLIVSLSVVNSLIASIIICFFFDSYSSFSIDNIVRGIQITGKSLFSSTFIVRIVVNIVDKGIAVILTFIVYRIIKRRVHQSI